MVPEKDVGHYDVRSNLVIKEYNVLTQLKVSVVVHVQQEKLEMVHEETVAI